MYIIKLLVYFEIYKCVWVCVCMGVCVHAYARACFHKVHDDKCVTLMGVRE